MARRVALALSLAMTACGGDDASDAPDAAVPDAGPADAPPDAAPDAAPDAPIDAPSGQYTLVAKRVSVPQTAPEANQFGVNVDNDADGADNKLGQAIVTLGTVLENPTLVRVATDAAVARGTVILLAEVQADEFDTTAAASIQFFAGTAVSPTPCSDPDDLVCGHHLDGTGIFTALATPPSTQLPGTISGGLFRAGPGTFTLQISLREGSVLGLPLVLARIESMDASATGGIYRVGGAILESDFDSTVLPAIRTDIILPIVDADCTGTGPDCGCEPDSNGSRLLSLLDDTPDCNITELEIKNDSVVGPLLRPDITLDTGELAVSVGVMVELTTATFDAP